MTTAGGGRREEGDAAAGDGGAPRRPSTREMAALAASIVPRRAGLRGALQRARPWICPFERIVAHVPPGASVLDVGCGGGLFLGLLAALGRLERGTGFDPSEAAIVFARAMAGGMEGGGRLSFHALAAEAPWPAGVFDVVSMIDVLHHVPPASQRHAFDEAARHVPAGGRLIYKDMCTRPRWRALANRLHDLVLSRQWIRYVPIASVDEWALAAGLETVCAERIDRWWYGHELRVYRRAGRD